MIRSLATALGIGVLIASGAACSSTSTPNATPTTTEALPPMTGLPQDTALVKTVITRPTTVSSVDPAQLPADAAPVNKFPGLSQDEKNCADTAILVTVKADPTAASGGKLAGVMSGAVMACADPAKLADTILSGIRSFPGAPELTDANVTCIRNAFINNTDLETTFIGSLLIANPTAFVQSLQPLQGLCGVNITNQ